MIGIITAMEEETIAVKEKIKDLEIKKIYNIEMYKGKIAGKEVILAKCGVGKVNAARVVQLMIDRENPEYIVNVGSAGASNPNLDYGDIVISEKLLQHDFDITAFGHEKGYKSELGKYFEADKNLVEKSKSSLDTIIDDN